MVLQKNKRYVWILFQIFLVAKCTPQCMESDYVLRKNEYRRSAGHQTSLKIPVISDYFLEEGWYRFQSGAGNDMVTTPPSLSRCGTLFPIWLRGTIPNQNEGIVNRDACVRGLTSPCESIIPIQIRNCGNFTVYHLRKPYKTATGYCIGKEVKCPEGKGSETGFTPACDDVPSVKVTPPSVVSAVENGTVYVPDWGRSVIPIFKCEFGQDTGHSFVYDVYWYINGDNIKKFKNIPYENLSSTWLRPNDWVKNYDLNMVVSCSVGLRFPTRGSPSNHIYSEDFAAGIFPTRTSYLVKEGEEINIRFNVTVPLGCNGEHLKCTAMLVYLLTPKNHSDPTCNTNKDAVSFDENGCGLYIKHGMSVLREGVTLHVIGNVDDLVNVADRTAYIRLGVRTNVNGLDETGVWEKLTLPDIKIHVIDSDIKVANKICYANTDPRMHTFDGESWNANLAGEFVMYRNRKLNIAVHSLFTSCNKSIESGGFCTCGIAVRVKDSFYVYRTCATISYSYVNALTHHSRVYEACDDRNMYVEVKGDHTTIHLPTGTKVEYGVSQNFLQYVHIISSYLDWNNTEGICGNVNGNPDDDFIPRLRNRHYTNLENYTAYVLQSWRIDRNNEKESLFIEYPNLDDSTKSNTLRPYCSCHTKYDFKKKEDYSNFRRHYTANCKLTAAMAKCSRQNTNQSFTRTCRRSGSRYKMDRERHRRVKRSLTDSDDIIEFIPLSYDQQFDINYKPPVPKWRNGWNESTARDFCERNIMHDPAKKECEKHIKITSITDDAVRECVLDIRDSGTAAWLEGTIDSIKSLCNTEIRKYEKFYLVNDTENESVVDKFSSYICANNCSGKGRCIQGECVCVVGYISSDCSRRIDIPPSGASIPEKGICKKTLRQCIKTNIMGNFYSEKIYTRCQFFRISETGKSAHEAHIVTATYRNPTLISVTLPTQRHKHHLEKDYLAYGYDIQLSYDGRSFGNNMSILIYDDNCIACNESLKCTKSQKFECSTTTADTTVSQITESSTSTTTAGTTVSQLTESSTPDDGFKIAKNVVSKKRKDYVPFMVLWCFANGCQEGS